MTALLSSSSRAPLDNDDVEPLGLSLLELEEEETTEVKEAFRRRLAEHDKWQIERDPAIKMFSKWYGEEWANAYASEVLFPLAKECDE